MECSAVLLQPQPVVSAEENRKEILVISFDSSQEGLLSNDVFICVSAVPFDVVILNKI